MRTPILTAAQMREADRLTIEDAGIAGLILMENAGRVVANSVERYFGQSGAVCVVCGPGNNGGDGFVAARYLAQRGLDVSVLLVAARGKITGEAETNLEILDTLGITIHEIGAGWTDEAILDLDTAELIIDALFGTGLARPIEGFVLEVIERINDAEAAVVSIDLPSGVDADTGRVLGAAVVAQLTVTLAAHKPALWHHPGSVLAGDVVVAEIGIPVAVIEHVAPRFSLNNDWTAPFLPERHPESHKGSYGHVLVLGGSPGKGGAPLLSALAALRSGAGVVTVGTHARCQLALEGRILEIMVEAAYGDEVDSQVLESLLNSADVVVVGPGLPTGPVGAAIVRAVLERTEMPVVLDAGALDVVSRHPELLVTRASPLVVTPHPGEAARLLHTETAAVQSDRFGAAERLVDATMAVVVLKGYRTLIASPDGPIVVNTTGNPGMATAGTGDVLAGMIGALLARDFDLEQETSAIERAFDATRLAVHLHGLAGDEVAARLGPDALIASDLIAQLSSVLRPPEEEPEA